MLVPVVGMPLSAVPRSALNMCEGKLCEKDKWKIKAHTTSACKLVMSFKTAEMPASLFVFTVTGDTKTVKEVTRRRTKTKIILDSRYDYPVVLVGDLIEA